MSEMMTLEMSRKAYREHMKSTGMSPSAFKSAVLSVLYERADGEWEGEANVSHEEWESAASEAAWEVRTGRRAA